MRPPPASGQPDNSEVDLRNVFRQISYAFSSLIWGIVDFFRSVLRNFVLFAGILAVFVLIALGIKFFLPRSFETEGVFLSRNFSPEVTSVMVANLNDYARKTGNNALLSGVLNVKPEVAGSIRHLSVMPLEKSELLASPGDSGVYVYEIRLRVADSSVIDEVEGGLVYYLLNNEYSSKRRESRSKALAELRQVYDSRIGRLDSLEQTIGRSTGMGSGTVVLADRFGAAGTYEVEMAMQQKRLDLIQEIETEKDIEILQPLHKPASYNYPEVDLIALIVVAFGFLLAMVLAPVLGRH